MEIKKLYLLAQIDIVNDYFPLAPLTNLVDLVQKCILLSVRPTTILNNYYFTYLDQKSFPRCFILLIPILGNIIIATSDFIEYKRQSRMLMLISKEGSKVLQDMSSSLLNNKRFMILAIQKDYTSFEYATQSVQKDPRVQAHYLMTRRQQAEKNDNCETLSYKWMLQQPQEFTSKDKRQTI